MIKRIVFVAALALVVVGISAPDASAFCNPPKFLASFNSVNNTYTYWTVADQTNSAPLSTKITSANADVGGTCQFLYWAASPGQVGIRGDFGQACATGTPCPSGSLSLIGQAGGSIFGATVSEGGGALGFDYSLVGGVDHIADAGSLRPRVTSSSRAAGNVNLGISIDAATSAGLDSATAAQITGYNILSAQSLSNPGSSASAYTHVLANVPAPSGAAVTTSGSVDCTNISQDRWVVVQIVTTSGPLPSVGAATQIKCNPALADPKFKPVPKKVHPENTGRQK